jgi:vacuolar-type H+-ATPase subunit I/STV1
MEMYITLGLLAIVSFVQNMFFTLVSRSRNSGDPGYHRYCAWGSNGVWFICQVMIVKNVWAAINEGNWLLAGLAGLVYAIFTTEGSVLMMKRLLKAETGKRKVGATGGEADNDKLLERIKALEAKNQEQTIHPNSVLDMENTGNYPAELADLENRIANLEWNLEAVEKIQRINMFDGLESDTDNIARLDKLEAIQAIQSKYGCDLVKNLGARVEHIETKLDVPFNDGTKIDMIRRINALKARMDAHDNTNAEIDAENALIDADNEKAEQDFKTIERRIADLEVRLNVNKFLRNKLRDKVANQQEIIDDIVVNTIRRNS